MKNPLLHLLIFFAGLFSFTAYSQNLELIGKEKPLRVNGGVSLTQVGYLTGDSISRRDPYNFFLSGNINFDLYGWSVPFTFSYSNQKTSYTQPFNQYSMHPFYKWIRLHLGSTSMTFSPYTLNGHLFLGGGAELSPPGSFAFSAMAGRLRKAVEYDSTLPYPLPAEYERWGYGMKGEYTQKITGQSTARLGITAFHASDKPGSLHYLPDSMTYPGENFVLGTNLDITLAGKVTFNGELASSAITRNTQSDLPEGNPEGWNHMMGSVSSSNGTSEFHTAGRMHLGYNGGIYSAGMGYERIDPGYETYGAYYFNSDLENITVDLALQLFDSKVNLAANVGKQRDNLGDSKTSAMKRWVTAFNLGYNSGERLNASASFSTFNSFMHIRSDFTDINSPTPYENLDTLDYTQLSSTFSANAGYLLRNTERVRRNLSMNVSYQKATDQQGYEETSEGSRFYNMSASYSYSLVPAGLSASAAWNTGINLSPDMENITLGPTISMNKLLLDKKLRTNLSCSYNQAYADKLRQNRVLSLRLNSGYRLGKRHNFNLGITFMNRTTHMQETPRTINEFIATLGYTMNF